MGEVYGGISGYTLVVLQSVTLVVGSRAVGVNAIPCKAGEKTLGVEDKKKVKDFQLTSSSSYLEKWASAAHGRLYNIGEWGEWRAGRRAVKRAGWRAGWRAGVNDKNPWIQVDLGKKEVVSGIATQGGYFYYQNSYIDRWVKTYFVKYSLNGTTFETYKDEGDDKIFDGNSDWDTIVKNVLHLPITARYIRIHPVSWRSYIGMRIELYEGSCNTSEVPFGVEDGKLNDSQMSSSIEKNGFSASKGRLNGAASWRPGDDNQNEWLQVDLGKKEFVTAIATQGSGDNYWVFAGNYDWDSVVTNRLYPAINARYIRIHPLSWFKHISLRIEVIGCYTDKGFCNTSKVPFSV
ncbi:lactadherin-like [Dendronephthya gigantea]|uniref:lactadherin-like n=1 Tax=Dendronephthya gigantea TaxID=151771 RepID=UPI00106C5BA6|nr:lactadherin-like [Dendronephthya gigantea]